MASADLFKQSADEYRRHWTRLCVVPWVVGLLLEIEAFVGGAWKVGLALDVVGHLVLLLPVLAYDEGRSALRNYAGRLSLPSPATSPVRGEPYRTATIPPPEVREAWLLTGVAPRWSMKICALLVGCEALLVVLMFVPPVGLMILFAAPVIVILGRIVLYAVWLDYLYGDAGRVAILRCLEDRRWSSARLVLHDREGRVPVSMVEEDSFRGTFQLYGSGSVSAWKVVCSLDPAS